MTKKLQDIDYATAEARILADAGVQLEAMKAEEKAMQLGAQYKGASSTARPSWTYRAARRRSMIQAKRRNKHADYVTIGMSSMLENAKNYLAERELRRSLRYDPPPSIADFPDAGAFSRAFQTWQWMKGTFLRPKVGPGFKTVHSLHRSIGRDLVRQSQRKDAGRHVYGFAPAV